MQWAFGVSASAGGAPPPELVQLYERYILGEIDLCGIRLEMELLYPKHPTTDPYLELNLDDTPTSSSWWLLYGSVVYFIEQGAADEVIWAGSRHTDGLL